MNNPIVESITSPLFTSWSEQHVRRYLPGVTPGTPLTLTLDGAPWDYQYTGGIDARGAEVLIRLGFAKGQTRRLEWLPSDTSSTNLTPELLDISQGATIGVTGRELEIPSPSGHPVTGPLRAFAGFGFDSEIKCALELTDSRLRRISDGPLYTAYDLQYSFGLLHAYRIVFTCLKHENAVLIDEHFHLGIGAQMSLTLNPAGKFDRIRSHRTFEFEGEPDLLVDDLARSYPADILCRLHMPTLGEYSVPNNRGWFALEKEDKPQLGMLGILGLYGTRWSNPTENVMTVSASGGAAVMTASLLDGERHWMMYVGPVEREVLPGQAFTFHRLHAEFNAFRLDEHLDLDGSTIYDDSLWQAPGLLSEDFRKKAASTVSAFPSLQRVLDNESDIDSVLLDALVTGRHTSQAQLATRLFSRFEKWVIQFQGFRDQKHDYHKNVIGFARELRYQMMRYEVLRRDGAFTTSDLQRLSAYFVFAARRITDESRWPHMQTWLHPDHPQSVRDFYTYPGEHKPDRLVWTNSLPNFQSDPTCALLHLSCLFADHPDAIEWRRFAIDDLERNLDAYCGPSGAWEESINYALFTFSYFIITFRILKNRFGIDYFEDERMRRFAGWLVRFFGPCDKRFGSYVLPAIGNAVLPTHGAEWLLCYAGELADGDPLRDQLIAVYQLIEKSAVLSESSAYMIHRNGADTGPSLHSQSSEQRKHVGSRCRLEARPRIRVGKLFVSKDWIRKGSL